MPAARSSSNRVVRVEPPGRWRAVVCVLAFVATAVVVYRIGQKEAGSPRQYVTTATVLHRLGGAGHLGANQPERPKRPDLIRIERLLLSDESLDRAVRQLSLPTSRAAPPDGPAGGRASVEQIRQNVRVTAAREPSSDRIRISIAYSDPSAARAVQVANALAGDYAEQHGAKREATLRRKYVEAQEAAERARQELFAAKSRFEEFLRAHFSKHQSLADQAARRPPATSLAPAVRPPVRPSRPPAESPPAEAANNPQRRELTRQLADLERVRKQLLVERKPKHPAVQDVDDEIARVKGLLASTVDEAGSRESQTSPPLDGPALPGPTGDTPPVAVAEPLAAQSAEEHAQAVLAFRTHRDTVDQARQEYDRLCEARRQAWREQLDAADIELRLAETCEVRRPENHSPRNVLVALVAAVAVATGVGLMSAGLGADVPLVTDPQVQDALGVPIVGRIPATGPSPAAADAGSSRRVSRRTQITVGLLMLALCVALVAMVF